MLAFILMVILVVVWCPFVHTKQIRRKLYTGLELPERHLLSFSDHYKPSEGLVLPESLDLRDKGLVTDVKDQGDCSSCYIFSAVAAIEGQFAKATGNLISLSEQKYLDCASHNCSKGGWPEKVFNDAKTDGGFPKDTLYPYVGEVQECHNDKSQNIAVDSGYMSVPTDEQTVKSALFEIGPLSATIFVTDHFKYDYTKVRGVFRDDPCSDQNPNHAVLLIGYGVDGEEGPYWLLKNSWGVEWREGGYARLERSSGNVTCLRSENPTYPILVATVNNSMI